MLEISTKDLVWIYISLVHVPVSLLVYWKLNPRLSPTSKRLAIGLLAAQVLLIVLSLAIRPTSFYEEWLWGIDGEWNILSTLASTQLAMIGCVALFTTWLSRAKPAWQRLYMLGVGFVFIFLGLDEFFDLRGLIHNLRELYIIVGAVIVVATSLVVARSPRGSWIWQICLMIGLSLIAMGGLVIDSTPKYCDIIGFLRFDGGCLETHYLEESLEFLGAWLVLVAMLGQFSGIVPMPQPRVQRALYVVPALWILLLIRESPVPNVSPRPGYQIQSAAVRFESGEYMHGYRIEKKDDAVLIQLYSYPWQSVYMGLGYSVHLVDQVSGDSIASRNILVKRDHPFNLFHETFIRVYVQDIEIDTPPQTSANRGLWIVLSHWRKHDRQYLRQEVLASDHQLLNDTQVVLGELVLPAMSAASTSVPLANFDNGFTLDAVDLPERVRAGETLTIPFTWRSDVAGGEDHVQFLHFGHEESSEWWVYDQLPLGPRLPTRLWYSGLADSETWQVPLPADLAPGRYNVFTGLYRSRDLERVPASDADGTPFVDARVPLGILNIEQ